MFINYRPPWGLPTALLIFTKLNNWSCDKTLTIIEANVYSIRKVYVEKNIVFHWKTTFYAFNKKQQLLMFSWQCCNSWAWKGCCWKVFVCGLPDDSCSVLPAQISASKTASLLSRATVHCCYYIKPGTEQHGYKTGLRQRPMVSYSFHCANNHL